MTSLLLSIGGPAVGLVASLYFLWRMSVLRRECDSLKARAVKAENGLESIRYALAEENKRLEAQVRVVRTTHEALKAWAIKVTKENPGLVPDYVRGMFGAAAEPIPAPDGLPRENAPAPAEISFSRNRGRK